jgi:type I restriction enzyme, S subunit
MSDKITKSPQIRFAGFTDAWEQRELGKVVDTVRSYSLSRDVETDENSGFRYVHYGDIHKKVADLIESDEQLPMIKAGDYDLLQKGDVIVADASEDYIGIAEPSVLLDKPRDKVVAGLHTIAMRPKEITPLFLYYLLHTDDFKKFGGRVGTGMKVFGITKKNLFEYPTVLPIKEEQEKIGNFFYELSHLITLHQRKLEQLKETKKSLLQKMFPKDGANVPEIRFAGFTDAWQARKFNEVFAERRDKTKVENEDTLLSCAINGMFLNSELFGHFRGSSTIGYLKVKKNDLILSAQNLHLGNANVNLRFEHGIISPAYKVYELIDSEPNFIQAWVKKDKTKNFFLAATTEGASQCRKNIEWDTLYKQEMFLPSYKEQEAIGAFFKSLDNLITLHQRELNSLKYLKKSLLQQLFV